MADRLCYQDRRNVTDKNLSEGSDALRKSLALYLRNWKKGYCVGKRERVINMLAPAMLDDMLSEHGSFCEECEPILKEYDEKEMRSNLDLRDEWIAFIDNMMDRQLASVLERQFEINYNKIQLLLDVDADEKQIIELLELFFETNQKELLKYKGRFGSGKYQNTVLALFLVKRKEILSYLDEDMRQCGWELKVKQERTERLLYRLEYEIVKECMYRLDIQYLLEAELGSEYDQTAKKILNQFVGIKRDEPCKIHRMQLLIHLCDELVLELLGKIKELRNQNADATKMNKTETIAWLNEEFEVAYKVVYSKYEDSYHRALEYGSEDKDAVNALFRDFMKRKHWLEIYEGGLSSRINIGTIKNPIYVDVWDIINRFYITFRATIDKFQDKKKVQKTLKQYGFNSEIESEWVERMLLIILWDFRREVNDMKGEIYKTKNSKNLSYDSAQNRDDDDNRGAKGTKKDRALLAKGMLDKDQANYFRTQYSVLSHARLLIQKALKEKREPHKVMPFIYYTWILPYEKYKDANEILAVYGKYASGSKTAQKGRAKGYGHTQSGNELWDEFSDLELACMRLDMGMRLDAILKASQFTKTLEREDYSILDQKLDIWDTKKNEQFVIRPGRDMEEWLSYEIVDKFGNAVLDQPNAEYHKIFGAVVSSAGAISKNMYQMKYGEKKDKETKLMKPKYDWEQIQKEAKTYWENVKRG